MNTSPAAGTIGDRDVPAVTKPLGSWSSPPSGRRSRALTGDPEGDARALTDLDCGDALALGLAVWMNDVRAAQMIVGDADVAASQDARGPRR